MAHMMLKEMPPRMRERGNFEYEHPEATLLDELFDLLNIELSEANDTPRQHSTTEPDVATPVTGTNRNQIENSILLDKVISSVTRCGIKIMNITFDGHSANVPACKLLGAKLKINCK